MSFTNVEPRALKKSSVGQLIHLLSLFLPPNKVYHYLGISDTCFADFSTIYVFLFGLLYEEGKEFMAIDANSSSSDPPSNLFLGELCKILIITVAQYQNTFYM